MTFGHKNRKGFLFVDAEAVESKAALDKWVKLSLAYVNGLPKKSAKTSKVKAKTPAKAAKNLKGNGPVMRQVLTDLGDATGTLDNFDEDTFATVANLEEITTMFERHDQALNDVNRQLAADQRNFANDR